MSEQQRAYKEHPGLNGLVYRQYNGEDLPLFRDSDRPGVKPQLRFQGHARVFDMSNEDDVNSWERVIDLCSQQKAVLSNEEVHFNERTGNFMIYARWAEYFLQSPERSMKELNHDEGPFSSRKL